MGRFQSAILNFFVGFVLGVFLHFIPTDLGAGNLVAFSRLLPLSVQKWLFSLVQALCLKTSNSAIDVKFIEPDLNPLSHSNDFCGRQCIKTELFSSALCGLFARFLFWALLLIAGCIPTHAIEFGNATPSVVSNTDSSAKRLNGWKKHLRVKRCMTIIEAVHVICIGFFIAYFILEFYKISAWDFWLDSAYALLLCFHHLSEYLLTSIYHPENLSSDSFLFNNSPHYIAAVLVSMLEHYSKLAILGYTFPYSRHIYRDDLPIDGITYLAPYHCLDTCSSDQSLFIGRFGAISRVIIESRSPLRNFWFLMISYVGFAVAVIALAIRCCAICQASTNFTHKISLKKTKDHKLITAGLYSVLRHPSYTGWFYWATGTQLLLVNPFSCIIFAITSWRFFRHRIEFEETLLLQFFGQSYLEYIRRVPNIGIPFLRQNLENDFPSVRNKVLKTYLIQEEQSRRSALQYSHLS